MNHTSPIEWLNCVPRWLQEVSEHVRKCTARIRSLATVPWFDAKRKLESFTYSRSSSAITQLHSKPLRPANQLKTWTKWPVKYNATIQRWTDLNSHLVVMRLLFSDAFFEFHESVGDLAVSVGQNRQFAATGCDTFIGLLHFFDGGFKLCSHCLWTQRSIVDC